MHPALIALAAVAVLLLAPRAIPALLGRIGRALGAVRRGLDDPAAVVARYERGVGHILAGRAIAACGADPDPALARRLASMLKRLDRAARAGRRARAFPRLAFVVLSRGAPNASAGLGGVVFVQRSLADRLADDAELAAVLAHEVAHIALGHVIGRAAAGLAARAGTALASGGRSLLYRRLADAAEAALLAGYSRELEEEADAEALAMLARAGMDPAALIRALERLRPLEGAAGADGIFRSHPDMGRRIARLRALLAPRRR